MPAYCAAKHKSSAMLAGAGAQGNLWIDVISDGSAANCQIQSSSAAAEIAKNS